MEHTELLDRWMSKGTYAPGLQMLVFGTYEAAVSKLPLTLSPVHYVGKHGRYTSH